MEVSQVNNASLTFKNDGGPGDKFCLLQNAVWSTHLKLINVTGLHTPQKLQNKLNSLLNVGPTADTAILCSLCIEKDKDDTEDQLKIMWATKGTGSFFRTLSPQVKNGAGLQMKIELGDSANFQKVSQIYPLKNLVEREASSSLVMRLSAASQ